MATITAATAMFSACGRYRWWLERRWDSAGPTLLFIGLNPLLLLSKYEHWPTPWRNPLPTTGLPRMLSYGESQN